MMDRRDKQPFLPETRGLNNMCCCGACGLLARGTERAVPMLSVPNGNAFFFGPPNWVTRVIDDDDERVMIFTCDRCVAAAVDGPGARTFYDNYGMVWSPTRKAWEATPSPNKKIRTEAKNEETSMTTNGAGTAIEAKATIKEKAMGQATALGSAVALGGKLALVDEIGEIMVDIAREFGKDNILIAGALSDETGREFVKAFGAFLLHSGCTYSDFVPHADKVKYAAELQITASSETLLKPRMKDLRKLFGRLAEIGEKAAALEGGRTAEAEEEEAAPAKAAAAARR